MFDGFERSVECLAGERGSLRGESEVLEQEHVGMNHVTVASW